MIVSMNQAQTLVKEYLKHNIVPFIKGGPGIGKSAIVAQLAQAYNLELIDIRLAERDPTDIAGFPAVENGRSYYSPPQIMPLDTDKVPQGKNGWLIFLDEFSNAPPAVQSVAYKLVLDRMVGDRKLHPQVYVVAAGNRESDNCNVEEMSTALISRMACFEVEVIASEWAEYAASVNLDHRIIGLVNWRPEFAYTFTADAAGSYAAPRTWAFVDKIINGKPVTDKDLILLAPLIGEGVAREFIAFCSIYSTLVSVKDIIKNPETAPVPKSLDVRWATLSSVASHANEDSLEALLTYVNRFPGELRVVCIKQMVKRSPSLLEHPSLDKWFTDNANELL